MFSDYEILLSVGRKNIDIVNKIMEAYEGVGVVRTIDSTNGIVKILTIMCYNKDVHEIVNKINKIFSINIEILNEGPWKGVI